MEDHIQNWTYDKYELFIKNMIKSSRKQKGLSQLNLSEKLGYTSNNIYKMETGKNKISWVDFISILSALELEPEKKFEKYFRGNFDLMDLNIIFEKLFHKISIEKLAQQVSLSKKRFLRLSQNPSSLDAHLVFFLFGLHFPRFIEFIAELSSPNIPPEIENEHSVRQKLVEQINDRPWIALLRLYFRENIIPELNQSNIEKIATSISQSEGVIKKVINELKEHSLLYYDQTQQRWMMYNRNLYIANRKGSKYHQSIYWNQRLLETFKDPNSEYDLKTLCLSFSTSKENLPEVKSLIKNFTSQLVNTLNLHTDHNSELCVITLNFANLNCLKVHGE